MAVTGAHVLLYTSEPEKVRDIMRDVFGWNHVDAGGGWLIFGLPPAEIAVHPAEGKAFDAGHRHQFTLMCDDLKATVDELRSKGVDIAGEPRTEQWGIHVLLNLPGELKVMLYEPRHQVAISQRG
jgi:catechol 2,3-dioxygenase-like lactoylglutathione lyase family enzyme